MVRKSTRKGVQEGVLEQMIVGWIYDAKFEGFLDGGKIFRFILFAKYEVSVFREMASKM